MPIYVVRWSNLSAALVRARNEDDLIEILDEVGNPDGCRWAVYGGPLFLDFELAAQIVVDESDEERRQRAYRPLDPTRIRVEGAEHITSRDVELLTVEAAGETGHDMLEEIARFAFPATAAVYWDGEWEVDTVALQEALHEDAAFYAEHTWRTSQLARSTDPDDQLALQMDASPRWLALQRRRAEAMEAADDEDEDYEIPLEEAIPMMLDHARAEWLDRQDTRDVREMLEFVLSMLEGYERGEGS